MRQRWSGALIGVATLLALGPGAAQVRKIDAERLLTERFGFTAAEVEHVRGGKPVAKLLPTQDASEVGVFAAVRIDAKADRLVSWFKDIASFRKAAELGISRRLSDPLQIGDFADLSLDAGELAALQSCRPGNCDLRLGDKAIQRFQTEVDWTASDAGRRANLLTRQLLLGHAQAYLAGGDQALGAYHNDKASRPTSCVSSCGIRRRSTTSRRRWLPTWRGFRRHDCRSRSSSCTGRRTVSVPTPQSRCTS